MSPMFLLGFTQRQYDEGRSLEIPPIVSLLNKKTGFFDGDSLPGSSFVYALSHVYASLNDLERRFDRDRKKVYADKAPKVERAGAPSVNMADKSSAAEDCGWIVDFRKQDSAASALGYRIAKSADELKEMGDLVAGRSSAEDKSSSSIKKIKVKTVSVFSADAKMGILNEGESHEFFDEFEDEDDEIPDTEAHAAATLSIEDLNAALEKAAFSKDEIEFANLAFPYYAAGKKISWNEVQGLLPIEWRGNRKKCADYWRKTLLPKVKKALECFH